MLLIHERLPEHAAMAPVSRWMEAVQAVVQQDAYKPLLSASGS